MTDPHARGVERDDRSTGLVQRRSAELATSGATSAAKARIEAAYMVALHRPRDLDTVRVRLLEACRRPGFADAAMYSKPVGGSKIVGLSVRFAEEAARLLGNLQCEDQTIYDDPTQRIVQVSVIDLETNYITGKQVVIDKTVERKNNKGRIVLEERPNSYGETVYIVLATEDELANKQAAAISRARRNLLIEMIPGDITQEARDAISKTIHGKIEADPSAARKAVADGFAKLGVRPDALAAYLGHPLEQSSPKEIAELRDMWSSISQGETSWTELLRDREEEMARPKDVPAPAEQEPVPAKPRRARTVEQAPEQTPKAEDCEFGGGSVTHGGKTVSSEPEQQDEPQAITRAEVQGMLGSLWKTNKEDVAIILSEVLVDGEPCKKLADVPDDKLPQVHRALCIAIDSLGGAA